MRLVRCADGRREVFGALHIGGTDVIDLTSAWPGISDLLRLIEASDGRPEEFVSANSPIDAPRLPLTAVRLLAPIATPQKFLAIGGNYLSHRGESAAAAQAASAGQIWFNKQVGCIADPFGSVLKPEGTDQLDYEGELGVVIGRRCRNVAAEDVARHITGYLVCNDVSVRDWQAQSPTATLGKSFDTHGPIGPWITTFDEVGIKPDLAIRTWVNGELRQDARTSEMCFSVAEMVSHVSSRCTLEPGDVLATGTPAGIGKAFDPPRYLNAGDLVSVEIELLGRIENRIVDLAASS